MTFSVLQKPIYQISTLLSLYESPEFDLTEESCNSIIDMLLSEDVTIKDLGLRLLKSSNVIKFKETVKLLLWLYSRVCSCSSDGRTEMRRFALIVGDRLLISEHGVHIAFSFSNDEDVALFQKVRKRMIDCGYHCP